MHGGEHSACRAPAERLAPAERSASGDMNGAGSASHTDRRTWVRREQRSSCSRARAEGSALAETVTGRRQGTAHLPLQGRGLADVGLRQLRSGLGAETRLEGRRGQLQEQPPPLRPRARRA